MGPIVMVCLVSPFSQFLELGESQFQESVIVADPVFETVTDTSGEGSGVEEPLWGVKDWGLS